MRGALLFATASLLLAGCGTIADLGGAGGVPPARIYGGVRTDVEIVFVGRFKLDALAPLFLIDIPLSAALDTALLPFTVLRALIVSEPAPEK